MPDETNAPTPTQRQVLWTALTTLAIATLLGIVALVCYGFILLLEWSYPILLPLGLAVLIALVLEPAVEFLQKRCWIPRLWATLIASLLSLLVLSLFLTIALPPLADQTGNFLKNDLPRLIQKGSDLITSRLATWPDAQNWVNTNLGDWKTTVPQYLGKVAYNISAPIGQAFGFLFGFGFVPIYAFYFLLDKEQIANHWHEYIPLRRAWWRDEVITLLSEINQSLVNFFRGQLIVAACNGVLTFIGLLIIDIPNSLFIGFLAGTLSVVPFLGVIVSIIPALLLGLISSPPDWQPWIKPALVLGVFTLVQMSESMIVTPRIQSHSTGLHPVIIIVGILFWSAILPGLLGPIVAVPLTCALVVILRRYFWTEKPTESVEEIKRENESENTPLHNQ